MQGVCGMGSYGAAAGRFCALEKTIKGYAETNTDTVVVPELGIRSTHLVTRMITTICVPGRLVSELSTGRVD